MLPLGSFSETVEMKILKSTCSSDPEDEEVEVVDDVVVEGEVTAGDTANDGGAFGLLLGRETATESRTVPYHKLGW